MSFHMKTLLAIGSLLAACGRASSHASSMPSHAPDSTPNAVWRELTRPENVLVDPPGISGRVVKNTLYVRFRESAGEREESAALASVGGVVIGGLRMQGAEYYHVRLDVPADSGAGPLLRARDTLRSLPQVRTVLLDILGPTP
jgi:hypothetical protein